MSSWLRWRLCALLGTSFLIGGATYLHAQNTYPAAPSTPEEAGTQFYQLLTMYSKASETSSHLPSDWTRQSLSFNSISRSQMQSLVERAGYSEAQEFLIQLAQEISAPQFDAHVTDKTANGATVEVTPVENPGPRPLVVIAEDGGYRVDLKATYGRWHHFSGAQLDEEWFKLTGVPSDAFKQSGEFARTQCQSQLKQQMLGILQYTQDYDEKYPPAREWVKVVQPYARSEQIFKCPSMPKAGYGYAFNQYFSRKTAANVDSPATTINVYETSNPSRNWFGPGTGKAFRHLDGWNLGFADGHVKWLKREADMSATTYLASAQKSG